MQGVNVKACGCIQACSSSCRSTRYQRRKRERSLKQTTRTHEHIVNGSIQEVPVKFTESVGLLCPVCGFHISKRGIDHVVSVQRALGIV